MSKRTRRFLDSLRFGRGGRRRKQTRRRFLQLETLNSRELLAGQMFEQPNPPTAQEICAVGHTTGHDVMGQMDAHTAAMNLAAPATATHSVVRSGNWSDPSVWANDRVPTDMARVHIPAGLSLTVDGLISETVYTLRIDGTLRFDPSIDTELKVDTVIGAPGSLFEMGTSQNPIQPDKTARVLVADTGAIDRAWDPRMQSRGLLLHGCSIIHGAAKNSWSTVDVTPVAGDTTLVLSEDPTGWRVGDSLAIAGTRMDATGDEVRQVAAINGRSITLNRALNQDHVPPAADLKIHVSNMTRNAVIESQNTTQVDRRGHLMFMHTRNVDVRYLQLQELGRSDKTETVADPQLNGNGQLIAGTGTNPRGRYSMHFHINGTNRHHGKMTPAFVQGVSVVGSPGWGYVNHSGWVDFIDNVSYDVDGAAFNTEVGDEIGRFVNNLSIRTHGTGDLGADSDNEDYGKGGDGFWIHGTGIEFTGNVATGATGAGIIFWGQTLRVPMNAPWTEFRIDNLPDPAGAAGHPSLPTNMVPMDISTNSVAYGSDRGFEVHWHRHTEFSETQTERIDNLPAWNLSDSLFENITVWNSRQGVTQTYNEDTVFRNVRVINAWDQVGEIGINAGENFYVQGNQTYENISIEGFETGFLTPRGETVTINNASLANGTDIAIPDVRQTHRRMQLTGDIVFNPLPASAGVSLIAGRQNIVKELTARPRVDSNVTWFFLSDRIALDFGSYIGKELFSPQQAANHIVFPASPTDVNPEDPGFSVPSQFIGLTNAQWRARYGFSLSDSLLPSDAADIPNDGIVGMIGNATPESLAPVRPLDTSNALVNGIPGDFEGPPSPLPLPNPSPSLLTNRLSVQQGGTVAVNSSHLDATDPNNESLTFSIIGLSNGQFLRDGLAVNSFTKDDVAAGRISFVHDGSIAEPCYRVTVRDSSNATLPAHAEIDFQGTTNGVPILVANSLTVSQGASVLLNAANLSTVDDNTTSDQLVYTVSDVVAGYFERITSSGTPISSFTQEEVDCSMIRFVHAGSPNAPAFNVSVSDGSVSTPPAPATISFIATPSHSAVTPTARANDAEWLERFNELNARVAQNRGNVDLIWIGDSIVHGWEDPQLAGAAEVWDHYYGARRNGLNLGIGGDQTEHVLYRLQNGNLEGIAPKVAVVQIGVNNLDVNTPQEVADGVTAVVNELKARVPNIKVLLTKVWPADVEPTGELRAASAAVNELLAPLHDGTNVVIHDTGSVFLNSDGTTNLGLAPDSLHPNTAGYSSWARSIESLVASLMGDTPVEPLGGGGNPDGGDGPDDEEPDNEEPDDEEPDDEEPDDEEPDDEEPDDEEPDDEEPDDEEPDDEEPDDEEPDDEEPDDEEPDDEEPDDEEPDDEEPDDEEPDDEEPDDEEPDDEEPDDEEPDDEEPDDEEPDDEEPDDEEPDDDERGGMPVARRLQQNKRRIF